MEKTQERLLEEATKKFSQSARQSIAEFFEVDGRQELNIDRIEAMWGVLRAKSDEAIGELYNELVSQFGEKELLRKKKEH
jgi:hypothetical protein